MCLCDLSESHDHPELSHSDFLRVDFYSFRIRVRFYDEGAERGAAPFDGESRG